MFGVSIIILGVQLYPHAPILHPPLGLIASVASDVKAHFKKTKKEIEAKRNPEKPYLFLPKGELRNRVEEHYRKMREARKPPPKSNYERQLLKVVKAQPAKKKAG